MRVAERIDSLHLGVKLFFCFFFTVLRIAPTQLTMQLCLLASQLLIAERNNVLDVNRAVHRVAKLAVVVHFDERNIKVIIFQLWSQLELLAFDGGGRAQIIAIFVVAVCNSNAQHEIEIVVYPALHKRRVHVLLRELAAHCVDLILDRLRGLVRRLVQLLLR